MDFGGRWLDMGLSKWTTFDPLGEKFHPSTLNSYAVNSPIMLNDPNGEDWSITTTKDKNGNWQINITVNAAILNNSGSPFNVENYIAEQSKVFSRIFSQKGDGFTVNAKLNLREIKDKNELKSKEHLININSSNAFAKDKGGNAPFGGLTVNLNREFINEDGSVVSNATLSHELGHTGGLVHPFEEHDQLLEIQRNQYETDYFPLRNQLIGIDKKTNFMTYPQNFLNINMSNSAARKLQEIYRNPGQATRNQISTILRMYSNGYLNYENY